MNTALLFCSPRARVRVSRPAGASRLLSREAVRDFSSRVWRQSITWRRSFVLSLSLSPSPLHVSLQNKNADRNCAVLLDSRHLTQSTERNNKQNYCPEPW